VATDWVKPEHGRRVRSHWPEIPPDAQTAYLAAVAEGHENPVAARLAGDYTGRQFRSLRNRDAAFRERYERAAAERVEARQDKIRERLWAAIETGSERMLDRAVVTYLDEAGYARKQEVEHGPVRIVIESAFVRPAVDGGAVAAGELEGVAGDGGGG
jgi:acyl-CoA reductase-like NAD-dependent aldehyde dehydrogenase